MIDVVVFDMDGVLCEYRLAQRLATLAGWSGRTPEEVRAAIWHSGLEARAERGECSADDYLNEVGARLGYPLTAEQWVEARRAAMTPNVEMLALARGLRPRARIGMLTNNPWLLARHIGEVFPEVPGLFGADAKFSAQLGARKPEPAVYLALAAHFGVAPAGILFFDDDEELVLGARRAGLFAEHVDRGVAGVVEHLAHHGLA